MGHRVERVNEQLRREITDLLRREVRDPRVHDVTITAVAASRDLSHAQVHVTSLIAGAERDELLAGLDAAAAFIRRALGKRMHLRRVPELAFQWDTTLDSAKRIEGLIRQVRPNPAEDADTPAGEALPRKVEGDERAAASDPESDGD